MNNKNPFVVGAIGVGQAGTNIAQTSVQALGINNDYLCSINLSQDDLEQATLVGPNNRLHLDENAYGAGKNRNISKICVSEKVNQIIDFFNRIYAKRECNVIFIFFSTSGGTGSGCGPFITALLESDALSSAKPHRCCIIGVPLIGDLNEGKLLLSNTLGCLREVNILVENKQARFMPIYNQVYADIKDDITKWKTINDEAVRLIKRYLLINYHSKYSNLDPEDRFVLLTTPGIHSLLTFNPKDPTIIRTPFILPEGASVQKLGCELPMDESEARFGLIKALGANVTEPNFVGLYDANAGEDAIPIVHFAGFNNLANFVQPYQVQFSRLDSVDTTGTKANKSGIGFDRIEDNVERITKKNEMNNSKSPLEIYKTLL
jgi:hypothetical protein